MNDARRLWHLLEPIHAVTYFAPEAREATDALGLRGFWMGYVAQRVAPLGAVGPAIAVASFFGFHPDRIWRALPEAWDHTTPEAALTARRDAAVAALARLAADAGVDDASVAEAAHLAWWAADAADTTGRVLAAANQGLPRPDGAVPEPSPQDAMGTLWQAATTLREHRGDGHVAVLVARGVGPVEAHLIKGAAGEGTLLQESRAWPDGAWAIAADGLRERGLIDEAGTLTDAGARLHAEVEAATDELAAQPWRLLGPSDTDRLVELLAPLADAVLTAGVVPVPNPMGLRPGATLR